MILASGLFTSQRSRHFRDISERVSGCILAQYRATEAISQLHIDAIPWKTSINSTVAFITLLSTMLLYSQNLSALRLWFHGYHW